MSSQNKNKEGSITLKNKEVVSGTIKYRDWAVTPEKISFKPNGQSSFNQYLPEDLNSFSVGNDYYISQQLTIDLASNELIEISQNIKYDTIQKSVFLKQLYRGKVNLYEYVHLKGENYFIEKDQSFYRLTYKKYISPGREILEVNKFRNELSNILSDCKNINIIAGKAVYTERSLVNLLTSYDQCIGQKLPKPKQETFNRVRFTGFLGFGTTRINYIGRPTMIFVGTKFNAAPSFLASLSTEFLLNRKFLKHAILLEPQAKYMATKGVDYVGNTLLAGEIFDVEVKGLTLKANFMYRYYLWKTKHTGLTMDLGIAGGRFLTSSASAVGRSKTKESSHQYRGDQSAVAGIGFYSGRIQTRLRYEYGITTTTDPDIIATPSRLKQHTIWLGLGYMHSSSVKK